METNIELKQYNAQSIDVTITEDGTPVNITGYTLYFTAKARVDDPDTQAVIKKDVTNHTNAAQGKTSIDILSSDTVRAGEFYYDIVLKQADGKVFTLQEGKVIIEKAITQRVNS